MGQYQDAYANAAKWSFETGRPVWESIADEITRVMGTAFPASDIANLGSQVALVTPAPMTGASNSRTSSQIYRGMDSKSSAARRSTHSDGSKKDSSS